jgi:predicted nucleotidyltransferase
MNYNKIISVTGLGGLYELLASKADGAVVRSLEDNSTKFISSRQHTFSHIESIEVFTNKENTNLSDVFKAMKESKEKIPDDKADGKALKAYFEKVYPDMDFDKVYISDMKKMVRWFGIITKNGIDISAIDTENALSEEAREKAVKHEAAIKEGKPATKVSRKIEGRGGNRGS